ncbi:MAG TPA: response regulator [Vicinamibacterales bacterium]|nr:response regulator [Vicinamibacterales bacterium]
MTGHFGHPPGPQGPSPRAVAVLLVESDRDNRDLYAEYLRYSSAAVFTVDTTDAALPLAPHADVIVTGIRVMGTFDGIELVHRLRAADGTKATAIIVLTACVFERDESSAMTAGCDAFLRKPCDPEALVEAINRVLLARAAARRLKFPAAESGS